MVEELTDKNLNLEERVDELKVCFLASSASRVRSGKSITALFIVLSY